VYCINYRVVINRNVFKLKSDLYFMAEDKEIEREIRKDMGEAIIDQAHLPVSIEDGKILYVGKLTLEEYRKIFPNRDDCKSAYLTLISKNYIDLAEVVATTFHYNQKMRNVADNGFYGKAKKLQDRRIRASENLVKLLSDESPFEE